MRYLCSGNTCAKPSAVRMRSPYSAARFSGFCLVTGSKLGNPSAERIFAPSDRRFAVSRAMSRWSPVTIFTATP